MYLKSIELSGFKSFAKKGAIAFTSPIAGIVGPNGSGKSNVAEAFRFVLGEQSMKALRGKRGPDLIWAGNEREARANRARVALTFDNTSRLFDIDFDEVVIERVVHRDGVNEYFINGSPVRLKDITEMLARAHIGSSGHHIISQGEADRILAASAKERREMIEDALGLKTFHVQKAESLKKLEKVAENIQEVRILERELKPQLAFLKRQVEKLERARTLKRDLLATLATYIVHERQYLSQEERRLAQARTETVARIQEVQRLLAQEQQANEESSDTQYGDTLAEIDAHMRELAQTQSELSRARGRIEGQLASLGATHKDKRHIAFDDVYALLREVRETLYHAHHTNDTSLLRTILERLDDFLAHMGSDGTREPDDMSAQLEAELQEIDKALVAAEQEEKELQQRRETTHAHMAQQKEEMMRAQARYFELKDELRTLERTRNEEVHALELLEKTRRKLVELEHRAQDRGLAHIEPFRAETLHTREEQEEALREIERLEARLDESGGVDERVATEYTELKDRVTLVERELADLHASQQQLYEILDALERELTKQFDDGLAKIQKEFNTFFTMLFGGGRAELIIERVADEESDERVQGIEVRVQLPKKKIATLDMLSGGERALVSIALIFAMSQVNPPPFIILDETDAALDEANSRRYADIVRELAKRSQLILITHNRKTMEAAGELYGVTMGSDGVSKLLSVKFDEAVSVAK